MEDTPDMKAFNRILGLFTIIAALHGYTAAQTQTVDNARFINQSIPDRMNPGETYNLILTFENTGSTSWNSDYSIRVNSVDQKINSVWSVSEMELGRVIEPGNTATIELKVTAPTAEGVYPFRADLLHGSNVFGESSKPVEISVSKQVGYNDALNSSAFVEQTVPSEMQEGRSYKVLVSMTNTGKTTWKTGSYRLIMLDASGNPLTGGVWNSYSVGIDEDITPGGTKVFNFDVTPLVAGTYPLQWRMASGDNGLFGDASNTSVVTVTKQEEKKNFGKEGKE